MHPNAFLQNYWRAEIRPEVFVAMSFAAPYNLRFKDVIEPAITSIVHDGRRLRANRVDQSKSGDSILTEIVDGIAHAELVLADISVIGYDAKTGNSYRNSNVLYEVGIALSCRQSCEVLLIRDDHYQFLFDVSTIPHKNINFSNVPQAKDELAEELTSRLRERDLVDDARVQRSIAGLTAIERKILSLFSKYGTDKNFYMNKTNLATSPAISRLLDKQLLVVVGSTDDNQDLFRWTWLGYRIAQNLDALLPIVRTKQLDDDVSS